MEIGPVQDKLSKVLKNMKQFDVPILLTVYRRIDTTEKTLNAIRQVKPKQLFVIADGARNAEEKIKCDAARAVIDQVDWECEVKKNFSEVNMNCGPRIATGLSWVFNQVDRAIILEDDCLPEESFFYYCQELLERYKDNTKVMQIAGLNTQERNKKFQCADSYYFSRVAQTWGWATWRRAFESYEFFLDSWDELRKTDKLKRILPDYAVREYWSNLFDNVRNNKKAQDGTWDVQWFYNVLMHEGLIAAPKKNLITNIGFGEGAGSTTNIFDKHANMKRYPMEFPLRHPVAVKANNPQADNYTFWYVYDINSGIKKKVKSFLRHYMPGPYYWLKRILT